MIINVIEYCTVFLPKESKKIALFVNKFYLPVEKLRLVLSYSVV